MANAPLWITEAEIVDLLSLPDAIDALETVFAMEARGAAETMTKTLLMVGDNDPFQAIGGSVKGEGICGTKTWVNVAGKSSTMLVLFSLTDGACVAMIEATALGQMRTAAVTGVGTRRLAVTGADEMAIVGTGKQAIPQIAACHAVRPLKRVRVSSRDADKRAAFVEEVKAALGIETISAASLEDAVRDCPIVTLMTNSTRPFLPASLLAKGTHLNAMGAVVPRRIEFEDDVFDRADVIAVDSLPAVRELSAEFQKRFGEDEAGWSKVRPISQLVAEGFERPASADLTLYKAMGMGMCDVGLGIEVLKRARAANAGVVLPERIKKAPRLTR
jgi:alanine dehydrogenase